MKDMTIFEWVEEFQERIQNGASQSDIIQLLIDYENNYIKK